MHFCKLIILLQNLAYFKLIEALPNQTVLFVCYKKPVKLRYLTHIERIEYRFIYKMQNFMTPSYICTPMFLLNAKNLRGVY